MTKNIRKIVNTTRKAANTACKIANIACRPANGVCKPADDNQSADFAGKRIVYIWMCYEAAF
jgi:hypothetical protein